MSRLFWVLARLAVAIAVLAVAAGSLLRWWDMVFNSRFIGYAPLTNVVLVVGLWPLATVLIAAAILHAALTVEI